MAVGAKIIVRNIEAGVRPVQLRLPFRFGAITLNACPQLFVRVEIDGGGTGFAAEMMVPKWFDKRTDRSPHDNIEHLARAIATTTDAYLNDKPATSFELFARHYQPLASAGNAAGMTELSTSFGQAVIDRAVIDAMCRAQGVSFFDAARRNLFGIEATDQVPALDWSDWLASLQPLQRIEARHTVGLLDELDAVKDGSDGLPVSLRAVIRRYGHRSFKIKVGGDPAADLARLHAVLEVLDSEVGNYRYTLDGNEQYSDMAALGELLRGLQPMRRPLYIEQPVPRDLSFSTQLAANDVAPFLMDEADGTLDSFAQGRDFGWTGVSSKACKGVYKSLINRARCEQWNAAAGTTRYFMSAEDLTCQAGLAVQQDLALVALLGISHSERNGHHYGSGFGTAPAQEQAAFRRMHADLYDDHANLRIANGAIAIDSLFSAGYAHRADPDWQAMQPLRSAVDML